MVWKCCQWRKLSLQDWNLSLLCHIRLRFQLFRSSFSTNFRLCWICMKVGQPREFIWIQTSAFLLPMPQILENLNFESPPEQQRGIYQLWKRQRICFAHHRTGFDLCPSPGGKWQKMHAAIPALATGWDRNLRKVDFVVFQITFKMTLTPLFCLTEEKSALCSTPHVHAFQSTWKSRKESGSNSSFQLFLKFQFSYFGEWLHQLVIQLRLALHCCSFRICGRVFETEIRSEVLLF